MRFNEVDAQYKIDIIRQVDSAVSGDVKFDANLVVVQGS